VASQPQVLPGVPRQGDRLPWRGTDLGYLDEREILPAADFEDGTLNFK
jgi:hypothetical protein